jgi:hypothetical protein
MRRSTPSILPSFASHPRVALGGLRMVEMKTPSICRVSFLIDVGVWLAPHSS